jgi:hypothetical protein
MPSSTSVKTIDRGGITWPKPSYRFRAQFLHDLRAKRRQEIIAAANECQLSSENRYTEIRDFDAQPPYGELKLLEYVNQTEGQYDLCLALLKTLYADKAQAELDKLDMAIDSPQDILAELFGFTQHRDEDKRANEGGAPNPTMTPAT